MNTTGVPQVWQMPIQGGWPEQRTFYDEAVRYVHFPPVGSDDRFLFGMDRGGSERTQLYLAMAHGATVLALTDNQESIHEFGGWSPDGRLISFSANRSDKSRFDVYVQDTNDSKCEARMLRQGPGGYFHAREFSPDGRYLLVQHYPSNSNQFVHVLDVMTGEDRNLTPHDGEVRYLNPQWSPDGKSIYVLTDNHGDFLSLARIEVQSGAMTFVTRPDWDVEAFTISAAGQKIAWSLNSEGGSSLFVHSLTESPGDAVNTPLGVIEHLEFSRDGSTLAFSLNGPRSNYNVWRWDQTAGGRVTQITRASLAGVPDKAFVEPELVHYESFDGLRIPAWLYMPPPDLRSEQPPVIVYPHGGPESQSRPTFNSVFSFLVNRGYAIFAPNVRGSSGYGTRFMNLDNVRKRMDSVTDLAHGAYWLRDSGRVDARRMAVYGGSYGGFMVLSAITNYPDLYAAAIDVVGIANFVSFLENTGAYRRAAREAEYGSLENDREFLGTISPIHHVDKIRTPLMVIHGANDPRVPVGEAEQIVSALKARGVPVEYLRYEDEGHGLLKLVNRLDAYPKMADFLDRYMAK
jgi:dipeptidyl aminopeptidase/acylaminoacyl peptidase